ncbi:MAG TPA: radical SAM protein [Chloroflexota bacterium]|nr:radical SAM protein [Chloroflexota bacterium]
MADILFGQSYFLRFDPKLWEAMQPYPPLGTLYAASYIRERGYDVALFDAMLAESEAEWAAAIDREKPRIAVLYEDNFSYLSKMCLLRMRQAAFEMIQMAREQGCEVIVAGSDATDHPDRYLARGARFVLLGEGEVTLGILLDRLTDRTDADFAEIDGLAFVSTNGATVRTPRRPVIRRLDDLPFPAWDLVDVESYRDVWLRHHGYYSMNMVTTRGCPYRCNWCAKPIWGQRYNSRSPENVVAEMAWLKETYRPDHVWFTDDIMGLKPGWLPRFADLAEEREVRIPFKSLHRADLIVRRDSAADLARAGARTVWLGAESGSQRILDAMDKGTRVEQIYEATRRLHDAGVEVGYFLQFGYPSETRADIRKTLRMVRDCRPDDIGVSVSYPLPGTRFHDSVRSQLGVQQNWLDSNDLAMLYRGPYPTSFYRRLHRSVHARFRARKSWDGLRPIMHRPWRARPGDARRAAGLARALIAIPWHRLQLEWEAARPAAARRPSGNRPVILRTGSSE